MYICFKENNKTHTNITHAISPSMEWPLNYIRLSVRSLPIAGMIYGMIQWCHKNVMFGKLVFPIGLANEWLELPLVIFVRHCESSFMAYASLFSVGTLMKLTFTRYNSNLFIYDLWGRGNNAIYRHRIKCSILV